MEFKKGDRVRVSKDWLERNRAFLGDVLTEVTKKALGTVVEFVPTKVSTPYYQVKWDDRDFLSRCSPNYLERAENSVPVIPAPSNRCDCPWSEVYARGCRKGHS